MPSRRSRDTPDPLDPGARYAPFTARALALLRAVPRGRVVTYGLVAAAAGSPLAARQVARILASMSRAHRLLWHRVINRKGAISLPRGMGFEEQRALLRREGVRVTADGAVRLEKYLWKPRVQEPA